MMRSLTCTDIHDIINLVPSEKTERITFLLARMNEGDRNAGEDLLKLVIADLRKLAASYIRRERQGHTLQPTDLVNELWVKLFDDRIHRFENSGHFFAVCAKAMRQILIDYARRKGAARRGGTSVAVTLDALDKPGGATVTIDEFFELHVALEDLGKYAPVQEHILELRYFCGRTIEETAQAIGISRSSVIKETRAALAKLRQWHGTT